MRAAIFVATALLAAALPAQASKPKTAEERAVDLINRASAQANRTPACPQSRRIPESTFNHDPPSAGLMNLLGILRRPATAEDKPPEDRFRFLPGSDIDVDYIRVAHAADGRQYWIVPARDALHFDPMPQSCLRAIHGRLRKLSRGKPERVRRLALRFYNSMVASNRRLARRGPREGVFVFEKRGDGVSGGGGGGGLRFLREYGQFGTSGIDNRSAHVNGLIPDGVATVTSTFGAVYSRGPRRKPRRYPKPITRTDPVQDNMVSFDVARSAENAFPSKMVWRDADGKVVRVVRLP
ncbi:MAG TPA: hypothetical protein VF066_17925 [Thermoleophilaceae bacterium]